MQAIIAYLNNLNAPYREGRKIWNWRLFNDNCAHVAHNAFAEAGIWQHWPTGRFNPFAGFRFPVPKNEFVDLVMQTNDLPIADPDRLYKEATARHALLTGGRLPTAPGALVIAEPAIRPNEVYEIDRLRLIFYDNPFWGPYRPRLKRILREPRYRDLRANLDYFRSLYAAASQRQSTSLQGERGIFQARYSLYIAGEMQRLEQLSSSLDVFSETRLKAMA